MVQIITISLSDWFYDQFIKGADYTNRSKYFEGLIAKAILNNDDNISNWNKEKLQFIHIMNEKDREMAKLKAEIGRLKANNKHNKKQESKEITEEDMRRMNEEIGL